METKHRTIATMTQEEVREAYCRLIGLSAVLEEPIRIEKRELGWLVDWNSHWAVHLSFNGSIHAFVVSEDMGTVKASKQMWPVDYIAFLGSIGVELKPHL